MPKKAHVKEVRDAIAKKLEIGYAQIYKKAQLLANDAQISTEDGICLLAAREGINLNKYLPKEKVNEIRELHLKFNRQPETRLLDKRTGKKVSSTLQPRAVNIGKQFMLTDPVLPNKILNEAKEMSENVYPLLYVLENSIREVILRVMKDKYGDNWWNTKVSKEIIDEVQKRKEKEKENPWHGRRGVHEIYYTDILHLGRIVQNNFLDFKDILPSISWLTQKLEEISHSRNPVAHMNPLSSHDIRRIKLYFGDWQKQIKAKRSVIPEQPLLAEGEAIS